MFPVITAYFASSNSHSTASPLFVEIMNGKNGGLHNVRLLLYYSEQGTLIIL